MALKIWYAIEVHHYGLGKYRCVRGTDRYVVEQKARAQEQQWDDMWQRRLDSEHRREESIREREQRLVNAELERQSKQHVREREAQLRSDAKGDASWWREQERRENAERKVAARQAELDRKDERRREAETRTAEALSALDELSHVLAHTLKVNDAIQWERLKVNRPFTEPRPVLPVPLPEPISRPEPTEPDYLPPPKQPVWKPMPTPLVLMPLPKSPNESDPKYLSAPGALDKLFGPSRQAKLDKARQHFKADKVSWVSACETIRWENSYKKSLWQTEKERVEAENSALRAAWDEKMAHAEQDNVNRRKFWQEDVEFIRGDNARALERWQTAASKPDEYPARVAEWEKRREAYYLAQSDGNAAIDRKREGYLACEPDAVSDYCEMVLANSDYPDGFPQEFDLNYLADSRTLVLEYVLPSPVIVPTLKTVEYQSSTDDFKERHITPKEGADRYDALLYQIVLRTLHELFESDVANAVDAVVFNGLVTSLNTANGFDVTACVLSVQASKKEFVAINLAQVDPKACFRSLKGVAASQLSGLAPVAPILQIDKSDRRFVESYLVAHDLHADVNLATMDWEDFEHLIRELFEREFSAGGGEVRVTQASRDGGVDAVVFDPDPIRGGKIVIQAKRYTNTVSVSAVRDLFGTVINEGAMKGILVTTANYGPDAYEFARGKPLTLLNGANLLHLLERHGHRARIDLQEAKVSRLDHL
jgi:restriction system protein